MNQKYNPFGLPLPNVRAHNRHVLNVHVLNGRGLTTALLRLVG